LLPGLIGPDCAETLTFTLEVMVIPAKPEAPVGGEAPQLAFDPNIQSKAVKSTKPGVPPPPGLGTELGAV